MVGLNAVVDNADANAAAAAAGAGCGIGPGIFNIEIGARDSAGLVVEFEVPLLVDEGVVRHGALGLLAGELGFGGLDGGISREAARGAERVERGLHFEDGEFRGVGGNFVGGGTGFGGDGGGIRAGGEFDGDLVGDDAAGEFVALDAALVEDGEGAHGGGRGKVDEDFFEFGGGCGLDGNDRAFAVGVLGVNLVEGQLEVAGHAGIGDVE